MARPEDTGRKPNRVDAADDADAYSVHEFCSRHRISPQLFYKLKPQGLMPATFNVGTRVLISREAAAAWRREREMPRGSEAGTGCMARPIGDPADCMAVKYDHHSASSTSLFCASPAMWVAEKLLGHRRPVGAPAHRGIAVEDGVMHGLLTPDASPAECVKVAIIKFDTLMALSPDVRRERYRETISDMVCQALAELRPYGVPSAVQGRVEWKPDGLHVPVIGYFDFQWAKHGIIVDLKTTEKLPPQIKISHARQAALYASSDNMTARLTYVTPKKCETYELENILEHREALRQIAMRIENFLALSDDPEFFKSITVPDLESFYWSGPARQLAYEHWLI